eukprot:gene10750-14415_t
MFPVLCKIEAQHFAVGVHAQPDQHMHQEQHHRRSRGA